MWCNVRLRSPFAPFLKQFAPFLKQKLTESLSTYSSFNRFDPQKFVASIWIPGYNYFPNQGFGGTILWGENVACSDNNYCCAQLYCNDIRGCSGATVSLAYAPPPSTTCGGINVGLEAIADFTTLSCLNLPKGSVQSFTLTNPNEQEVSIILTDGPGAKNCDFQWGNDDPDYIYKDYSYNKRVLASTAASISFNDVTCANSPCCASIKCGSTAFNIIPCIGLSYSQSFTSPGNPTLETPSGVVAAIVIALLAAVAGAAFLRWRKVRKDQQMAMALSGAGAPVVVQTHINPVVPYGGAPPPVPHGQLMPPGPPPQQPSYLWT